MRKVLICLVFCIFNSTFVQNSSFSATDPTQASAPNPANGAIDVSPAASLSFAAGLGASNHDIYMGTAFADVNEASKLTGDFNTDGNNDILDMQILALHWLETLSIEPDLDGSGTIDFADFAMLSTDWLKQENQAYMASQASTSYAPQGLTYNTTYYWRVDETSENGVRKGAVWNFKTAQGKASNPSPANGATEQPTNTTLSWTGAAGASSHKIYFGTSSTSLTLKTTQTGTTYNPGSLALNTTYYWRIDEVTPSGTNTGDTWNFKTQSSTGSTANIKKGPYLIYPGTNTQMTVLWQLDATAGASIAWGTSTSYSSGTGYTGEYGTDHQHKYTINGLTPGTKYYYRVSVGSNSWTGSFTAAPASNATSVKFFAYGDTRTTPSDQDKVTSRMISTYTADPTFQTINLHVGDWVSSNGESYWTSEFFNRSYSNNLKAQANIAYMGSIGNHEGSATVFLKYWPYPFVAGRYYSFDYGPAHVAVVDQYTDYSSGSSQLTWLTNDLRNSTKPWKFIVLHAPGWSAGGHGNNGDVQSRLQPLCEQYGVQIVFGGHNHYYARALVNGVHHITVGGGGAPLDTPSSTYTKIVTTSKNLGFGKVTINGNTMSFQAVKYDGTQLDSFSITK